MSTTPMSLTPGPQQPYEYWFENPAVLLQSPYDIAPFVHIEDGGVRLSNAIARSLTLVLALALWKARRYWIQTLVLYAVAMIYLRHATLTNYYLFLERRAPGDAPPPAQSVSAMVSPSSSSSSTEQAPVTMFDENYVSPTSEARAAATEVILAANKYGVPLAYSGHHEAIAMTPTPQERLARANITDTTMKRIYSGHGYFDLDLQFRHLPDPTLMARHPSAYW